MLFNQFHDILPGSGVRETREHAMALFQEVGATTGAIKKNAITALTRSVDTAALLPAGIKGDAERKLLEEGKANHLYEAGAGIGAITTGYSHAGSGGSNYRALIVVNPNPFPVSQRATAALYNTGWNPKQIVVRDDSGAVREVDPIYSGEAWLHQQIIVGFDAFDVPACGYKTYLFTEGVAPASEPQAWVGSASIDTSALSIKFDRLRSGFLQLIDKRTGVDFASGPLGQWQFVTEKPRGMTSWLLGDLAHEPVPLRATKFSLLNNMWDIGHLGDGYSVAGDCQKFGTKLTTGVRAVWELEVPGTSSTVKVTAQIGGSGPRVDFIAEIDWREIGDEKRGNSLVIAKARAP